MPPRRLRPGRPAGVWSLFLCALCIAMSGAARDLRAGEIRGPLRVHPANPRYFTDDGERAIYLTGSHTWSSLQDNGTTDPPPAFDYNAYLDFLEANGHNFFRLWAWEQARWTTETSSDYYLSPLPYARTGPGTALDGKPKFDLTRFDDAYFDRLRSRVIAAGRRGIYVSVMLFDGWSIESSKGSHAANNPWRGHPFHRDNNINGIDGDLDGDDSGPEIHTLRNPDVTAIQEAYVARVIDTVNDLDNVLYEISNESPANSEEWQYHIIRFIKEREAGLPKQHPVGMTVEWPNGFNSDVFDSPADWVSPNDGDQDYFEDPPGFYRGKVTIVDTDHICGVCLDWRWVWKSFLRGLHPIFMDVYDNAATGLGALPGVDPDFPDWVLARRNMGYTLRYAERVDLAKMEPRGDLSTTRYCLANAAADGGEYLTYVPPGEPDVTLDLSASEGEMEVEWLDLATGDVVSGDAVAGGGARTLVVPFGSFGSDAGAALYVFSSSLLPPEGAFIRGDVNVDGSVDISDAVSVILRLFAGAAPFRCDKSADWNDSGRVDLADPIAMLGFLFRGEPPVEPFRDCGLDPTEDALTCDSFPLCR